MNINAIMAELAQYTRMAEEIAATVDSLKDAIKKYAEKYTKTTETKRFTFA